MIGSGSLSFEMIRALVERLPVMICPKWVRVLAQPIAIEDVLAYLQEAIELPEHDSKIYEIGGPDQVSYGEIMQEYAQQRLEASRELTEGLRAHDPQKIRNALQQARKAGAAVQKLPAARAPAASAAAPVLGAVSAAPPPTPLLLKP